MNEHNGILHTQRLDDDEHTAYVGLFDTHPLTSLINIDGGYNASNSCYLDPQQALSLRDWISENETLLKQLANYEYRKAGDFVEGDTIYLFNKNIPISEIMREANHVVFYWLEDGRKQVHTGHNDTNFLAVKREQVQG